MEHAYKEKRLPTLAQFEARYANARRVASKVKSLIDQGYRVFDEDENRVKEIYENDRGDIVYSLSLRGHVIMFEKDISQDAGAFDSIADYNDYFHGWTYLHPSQFKPLKV